VLSIDFIEKRVMAAGYLLPAAEGLLVQFFDAPYGTWKGTP
jgi:hypothetical protein